jgi:N-acetylglucosamine kinase-like BadF-type ATPase
MTPQIFLGVDVGTTKTQALLADEYGNLLGQGMAGGGNPPVVGYEQFASAVETAVAQALNQAQIPVRRLHAAGLGVSGYDWPSQKAATLAALDKLALPRPVALVNDTILGLLAVASRGWGISLVAGTGCNCWGRDENGRYGRVTGEGSSAGEYAGASELVERAFQKIARQWTKRDQPTLLASAFANKVNARHLDEFIEGVCTGRYILSSADAPLIFDCASKGDQTALALLQWAGKELGEMVLAVARQLNVQRQNVDVILLGGLFNGVPPLQPILADHLANVMPDANLIRLQVPPVIGAVRLAMEQGDMPLPSTTNALLQMHQQASAFFTDRSNHPASNAATPAYQHKHNDTTADLCPNPSAFVRANGRQLIVGEEARPVRLMGINFPAYGWGKVDIDRQTIINTRNFRGEDYRRIASLGMNVIRLNLAYVLFEDDAHPYQYETEGWSWLDQQIAWARESGVYLILDMHAPQGGYQAPGYTGPFWEADDTFRRRLKALWQEIARRYRHEPQIAAYGLLNEPCTHGRNHLWAAYAQELVNAIRAVDAHHLIDVELDVEGGAPFILQGENLMYDFHFYEPWRYAAQFWRYGFQGHYGDSQTPILPWTWREGQPVGKSLKIDRPQIIGAMPLAKSLASIDEFTITEQSADGKSCLLMRVKLEADSPLLPVTAFVNDEPYLVQPSHWSAFSSAYLKCERLAFPVRRNAVYTISNGLELLPLTLREGDEFAPFTRDTLETRLLEEYGLQFYLEHNLPVNVGEYGLSPHAFKADRNGQQWLADSLGLFAKYNVNAQYWVYSGAADFALYHNQEHYPAPEHGSPLLIELFRTLLNGSVQNKEVV